jgi:hypothetical protein
MRHGSFVLTYIDIGEIKLTVVSQDGCYKLCSYVALMFCYVVLFRNLRRRVVVILLLCGLARSLFFTICLATL